MRWHYTVPVDRFGRKRKDFAKVSLCAEGKYGLLGEYVHLSVPLVKKLQKEKFEIIALEQAKNSVDYKKVKAKKNTLVILGNEVDGVSKELLKLADVVAEIPMRGKKESLNVGVAAGDFFSDCRTLKTYVHCKHGQKTDPTPTYCFLDLRSF